MIPKIIHYCWFGPNPMPEKVYMCIDTWKKHLPDYELKLWNEENSPMNHRFVKDAYEKKKYAFVSDYVRLWALYEYGGVYLDTDMYIVKSLNSFLLHEFFLGSESANDIILSAGIIGCIPKNDFVGNALKSYDDIVLNVDISKFSIPLVLTSLYENYNIKEDIVIYPYDYFYPFPFKKRKQKNFMKYATINTYAIHLWNFSWLSSREYYFIVVKNAFLKLLTKKNA